MRNRVASFSRFYSRLVWYVLALFSVSMAAVGQTQILGSSQIQTSVDTKSAGTAQAFPATASVSGQVNFLSVFLDPSNTSTAISVALYSSESGHPYRLLSQAVVSQPIAGAWNSVQIPAVQVKSGRRYWLAVLGVTGQIEFRDTTGSYCHSETSAQTTLNSFPAYWSTGLKYPTCIISMFGSGTPAVSVAISPTTASLQPGQQTQFTASVSGTTNTAVTWTATGGTVTTSGLYTAPTSTGTYTVTATSSADPTKSASATVTVTQVSVSLSPGTASIQTGAQQQFTASVSGTTNTGVTWTTSGGTVTTAGLYTAPSTAGTYTVTVTSSADSTKSASASVAVSQPISVSISPTSAAMQTGGQQQFSAFVSGTSSTGVTWKVTGGTITTAGLYTAPTTAGTYTVTAVSAADGTTSASASVSVTAPQNVAITISPTTVSMPAAWQQQFLATVSGSTNTGVTWTVSQGTGTITQSGMYTAPSIAETDIVTAISQADTTKSAGATITVAAPHSVTLNWSPSTTTGVIYNVYRGTVSGGPYTLLISGLTSTTYTDTNVQSGSTYYYVTTAVDSSGESPYSNMIQAVIPMP